MRRPEFGLPTTGLLPQKIGVLVFMKLVKFGHHTMGHLHQKTDVLAFVRVVKLEVPQLHYFYYSNLFDYQLMVHNLNN